MSTDRWKIETPPGIGNMTQGRQPQKESTQGGEIAFKQSAKGEREEEDNEGGLE